MRIWVDVSTGTYGSEDDLVFVDVSDWTNEEFVAFDNQTDNDRSWYAYEIALMNDLSNSHVEEIYKGE
tara:strand:- start:11469 stop:11672 length:204 start_codon:yes stop_codon:yes gene_type:complete